MALHELTTNAVKHGALGDPSGRLHVAWGIEETDGEARLRVEWKESGVTVDAAAADRRGSGRELIERALPRQLGAGIEFAFEPDGVRCVIALPVSSLWRPEEV